MIRSGALATLAVCAVMATFAGATPPPPPGGYTYYNTSPGTVAASGTLVDQSSRGITTSDGMGGEENVGTLETQVYREEAGTLDFVYHITPATTGVMLHSLDVPWINNEVTLKDAGFVSSGSDVAPVTIARYNDRDPVSFLFPYSLMPGEENLDGGTSALVLITNAHAYTWSDAFTARSINDGNFAFDFDLGGFVPEHAPEPASVGVAGVGALLLMRRRRCMTDSAAKI